MTFTLRIATRDWDYLTPLLLGDVRSDRLELRITRVGTLIPELASSPDFDAAELSMSRYVSTMAAGAKDVVGLPCFIMRGFRHRCIITTEGSSLERLSQLRGKRIGVTGWRESGNTWTRAALRREGVSVEDAFWIAGRLTAEHPIVDRLDGFGRPGLIEADPGGTPHDGDACNGRSRRGFHAIHAVWLFRPWLGLPAIAARLPAAECAYYDDVGYVPAHHLVGVKADVLREHPWVGDELTRLIHESQAMWTAKRQKYAETSPWVLEELILAARALASDWNDSGVEKNRAMIAGFADELHLQGVLPRPIRVEDLFPDALTETAGIARDRQLNRGYRDEHQGTCYCGACGCLCPRGAGANRSCPEAG